MSTFTVTDAKIDDDMRYYREVIFQGSVFLRVYLEDATDVVTMLGRRADMPPEIAAMLRFITDNAPPEQHKHRYNRFQTNDEVECLDCGEMIKVEHYFGDDGLMRTRLKTGV